jgi:hypothetical protein
VNNVSRLKSTAMVAAVVSGLLFGCATSQKVQVVQPGDQNLSCNAISEELAKLDKTQAEIDSKKGVTGTNVVAALLWVFQVWRTPIMMRVSRLV